jgi:hypothetical protein
MRSVIGTYTNGNYNVAMLSDGTKIRSCKDDKMIPAFPESIDVKVTNKCDMGCKFCHEDSKPDGKHGNIMGVPFIDSLHPYTELAIGGGNPLEHPQLEEFLAYCKERKLIVNMTVNQVHFEKEFVRIKNLVSNKLIYGLGVSLVNPTPEFINMIREIPNAVIHIINGIVDRNTLQSLYDKGLKILILGYKEFRRGNTYHTGDTGTLIDTRKNWMHDNIGDIINHFDTVSFDNLAIKQLEVRNIMSAQDFNHFYMGDDGQFTMYVDTVKQEYAVSSVSTERYSYTDETIEEMFAKVRRNA